VFVLVLIVSVLVAVVPIVGYLTFIWWLDRYEREPLWLVIGTFLWGALGGTIGAIVVSGTLQLGVDAALGRARNSREISAAIGAVILAPLVEEATKGLILLILLLSKQFDNSTDGLIYGAATGLGFAMTENFLYFLTVYQQGGAKAWVGNMITRTLFSAVVHCCASGTLGFFLGLSRYRESTFVKLLLVPVAYVAGSRSTPSAQLAHARRHVPRRRRLHVRRLRDFPASRWLLVIGQSRCTWAQAAPANRGEERLHPAGPRAILPYWLKRRRKGWMPANVHRRSTTESTMLAFRKSSARARKKRGVALLKEVGTCARVVRLVWAIVRRSAPRHTEPHHRRADQYPPTGGPGQGREPSAALLVCALALQSCTPGRGPPLRPPPITGGHPAVGRALRLELTGAAGAPVLLEAVAGGVTVVCVGARAEDHAPCRAALRSRGDGVAA
jgi:hypothetical protein